MVSAPLFLVQILDPSLVPTFDNSWTLCRAQTCEDERSRLWACPWLCRGQAQWLSLAMAVASALSRATLATCRNHRGGSSTNLKPGNHSLSEFKHLPQQQPQTGIHIFLLQLNPTSGTSSTFSRCWCLKWAQVGKSQFPGEVSSSAVRLLQGVKSLGQGTSPTVLLMETWVEKQLRLSTLTAAEDTQFHVYYLKAFKSEKIKT